MEASSMGAFRDVASLVAVVSFVLSAGVWTNVLHALI
jgi:hypothetical protein